MEQKLETSNVTMQYTIYIYIIIYYYIFHPIVLYIYPLYLYSRIKKKKEKKKLVRVETPVLLYIIQVIDNESFLYFTSIDIHHTNYVHNRYER